ncbi:DinB family protein [Hymenobacter perfusus]|uniref:DinB family protein n=1 Tax=Hymenobacter perfusus TaxID=1236770 RepID=A0A428K857_9BACT|nr:DinB family protein [Hymenobacter perfusus]RSK42655.1 DinB family protein [Hymenobacter perfusus]
MTPTVFLRQLQVQTQEVLRLVKQEYLPCSPAALNQQPAPGSWSALECLEHLNRYSRYYLPELAAAVRHPARLPHVAVGFSWLGRKSCELVNPDNQRRHTTLARMNPASSQLCKDTVLSEFIGQTEQLLRLLDAAYATDLNRKTVSVEFFRLLRLRTGEALLFLVAHVRRHVAQGQRALAGAGK